MPYKGFRCKKCGFGTSFNVIKEDWPKLTVICMRCQTIQVTRSIWAWRKYQDSQRIQAADAAKDKP